MPAPTLSSSTPANGATDVAKNVAIELVFSEALLESSVTAAVVGLYNSITGELLGVSLSLSEDGTTITLVPHVHLMPNCGHRVRVAGADVSDEPLKSSSDETALAASISLLFQTGEGLEATEGGKTEGQSDLEGDATLPDDLAFKAVSGAPLAIVATSPSHHAFKIDPALARITFRFNNPVDEDTVADNLLVRQYAFYEEEAYRARQLDLGNDEGLRHYFMAETGYYNEDPAPGLLDPMLFRDRDYTISVTGEYIHLQWEDDYSWPKNLCVEVQLGAYLSDTDGNPLGSEFVWFGCTYPYPDWVAVMSVRHEAGHDVSGFVPDDFVGLRIWHRSIELLHESDWRFPSDVPNRPMIQYVRAKSAVDVWDDMLATKALAAGTSKRLGDLEITVTPAAGSARPMKVKRLEDLIVELERNLWYYQTQTPRIGIKSIRDALEPDRGFFRDRLWRAEIMMDRSSTPTNAIDANTALERRQHGGDLVESYLSLSVRGGWGLRHRI